MNDMYKELDDYMISKGFLILEERCDHVSYWYNDEVRIRICVMSLDEIIINYERHSTFDRWSCAEVKSASSSSGAKVIIDDIIENKLYDEPSENMPITITKKEVIAMMKEVGFKNKKPLRSGVYIFHKDGRKFAVKMYDHTHYTTGDEWFIEGVNKCDAIEFPQLRKDGDPDKVSSYCFNTYEFNEPEFMVEEFKSIIKEVASERPQLW